MGGLTISGGIFSRQKRRLTVKELTPEEIATRELLYAEQTAAQLRFGQFFDGLRKKYSGDLAGVNVEFDENYVLIRDYRDDLLAKQRNIKECGQSQDPCYAPPRPYDNRPCPSA